MRRHPRTLRRKLLLTVPVFLATLLGAELFLRTCAPVEYRRPVERDYSQLYRRSDVPGLEYEHVPGATVSMPSGALAHTNRHGLRNTDVSLEKPRDVLRVAAVGDSFTFGERVGDGQTFPFFLQANLTRLFPAGKRFEVLNFGVSGYSTAEEAALIDARVLAFEPDVVLLGYVLNDPDAHPAHGLHLYWHEPFWWERFELTRLAASFLADIDRRRLGYAKEDRIGLLHDPRADHWRTVEDGFDRIRHRANAADVPVVVVIFPLIGARTWERYSYDEVHEQVRRLAEMKGFRVLDLKTALADRVGSPQELKLDDNPHASPHGNRVFARLVSAYLAESVLPELVE